jgi:uncharacterized membrane protein
MRADMFDIITVIGFAITVAGIGLQLVSEFIPKEKKPKYYLGSVCKIGKGD